MNTKNVWNLESQLEELKLWLRPESTSFSLDEPRAELAILINEFESKTLDFAANCLSDISLWESQVGARYVLEGDANGWSHLKLGLTYSVWQLRTLLYRYKKAISEGFIKEVSRAHGLLVRCLAMSVAMRDDDLADWCGSLMLQELSRPTGFLELWDYTGFYPFMAWLYARWKKIRIDTSPASFRGMGVYQRVVDRWEHDEALAEVLAEASDYHCSKTVPSDGDDPEFWQSPFQVFPAEILAIQRIRHEETGVWLAVDHPLLNSFLCTVPDSIPLLEDLLLEKFKARLLAEEQESPV